VRLGRERAVLQRALLGGEPRILSLSPDVEHALSGRDLRGRALGVELQHEVVPRLVEIVPLIGRALVRGGLGELMRPDRLDPLGLDLTQLRGVARRGGGLGRGLDRDARERARALFVAVISTRRRASASRCASMSTIASQRGLLVRERVLATEQAAGRLQLRLKGDPPRLEQRKLLLHLLLGVQVLEVSGRGIGQLPDRDRIERPLGLHGETDEQGRRGGDRPDPGGARRDLRVVGHDAECPARRSRPR
jgi:hypothetical protein